MKVRQPLEALRHFSVVACCAVASACTPPPAEPPSPQQELTTTDPLELARMMSRGWYAADRRLAELGPRAQSAVPLLKRLFGDSIGYSRDRYVHVLGAVGGAEAIDALREELASPLGAHEAAILALARQGAAAAPAIEELRAHGLDSPYIATRAKAAALLRELGDVDAVPGPRRCPRRIDETPTTYRVTLADGPSEFSRFFPNYDAACFRDRIIEGNRELTREELLQIELAYRFDDRCVVGLAKGEWGGWVEISGSGNSVRYAFGSVNPRRIVEVGGRALLVSGLAHGLVNGELFELVETSGFPVVRPFARLPGAPVAFRLDGDGRLLLLVEGGELFVDHELGASCTVPRSFEGAEVDPYAVSMWVLRIEPDGHFTVLD